MIVSRPLQVYDQVLVCLLLWESGRILLFQNQQLVLGNCTFIHTCHLRFRNDIIIFVVQVADFVLDMRLILDLINFLALIGMVIFFIFVSVSVGVHV